MTTLLITGASGFIGRNLAEQLRGDYEVTAPTRAELDLGDEEAVRQWFASRRFDVVLHSATVRSNRMTGEPANLCADNCRMFFHLNRHRRQYGHLLYFGSGAEYDRRHYQPRMNEEYFDTHTPVDGYGLSKYLCAKYCERVAKVTNLRLFGVFGKYESWQVRFISNACCRVIHGLPIVIRRDVLFDYLYANDLAAIVKRFIAHPAPQRAYNVCTGAPVLLSALAKMVAEVSGRQPEIVVREPGLGTEYSGDNARLLADMGGFTFTALTESVGELYRWYEEHKEEIDPAQLRFDG
ncbi:MAG TPA: NAD(P)-dependent oxidoreductase [Terriglobia bacterium]|nr:NAD(P)-dependent oxidoreductase [Terriglobia bacterium]